MEWTIREATARLSALIAAARNGERVVITQHGRPAAELVGCGRRGGIDFDRLEAARRRLGVQGDGEGWPKKFDDSAFSRRVLGLDDEEPNWPSAFFVTRPASTTSWTGWSSPRHSSAVS